MGQKQKRIRQKEDQAEEQERRSYRKVVDGEGSKQEIFMENKPKVK